MYAKITTNGRIYPNLQALFANYVNLRPAQNWGLLQLTRTKHKANPFNVLCIARATINLCLISNVVQAFPLAPPPPCVPAPSPFGRPLAFSFGLASIVACDSPTLTIRAITKDLITCTTLLRKSRRK